MDIEFLTKKQKTKPHTPMENYYYSNVMLYDNSL